VTEVRLSDLDVSPDGAATLDELHAALTKYVVLPSAEAADAVTLWVATTHALPAFQHAPRLAITSPEKRCGKSRLLDIIEATCHAPLVTVNASVSAVYRSLGGEHPPTLLVDEADSQFGTKRAAEQHEDLRALLNAGHQRNRPALRCVGPQQTPTTFPTFAMAALAGIGGLPDTVTDRAVNVRMRRRAAGESVAQFRTRVDGPKLAEIRDRLSGWVATVMVVLESARPEMPVTDRAADTWEPLVAVADAAGDVWGKRARAACLALVREADEADAEDSLGTRLLSDIRDLFVSFTVSFMLTQELVLRLRAIEDAPWSDDELTAHKLAARLREYGVKPRRNTAGTARGYRREDFADAWRRFLPDPRQEASERQNRRSEPDTSPPSDTSNRQTVGTDSALTSASDNLTVSDGGSGKPIGSGPCHRCGKPTPRYSQWGNLLCDGCMRSS
jgi:Protein of unknown function (DUF3631)